MSDTEKDLAVHVAICNTAWTDEVKSTYRAMVEAQQSRMTA